MAEKKEGKVKRYFNKASVGLIVCFAIPFVMLGAIIIFPFWLIYKLICIVDNTEVLE